jgi:hypothetical protein
MTKILKLWKSTIVQAFVNQQPIKWNLGSIINLVNKLLPTCYKISKLNAYTDAN